jgi:hypothetical protein
MEVAAAGAGLTAARNLGNRRVSFDFPEEENVSSEKRASAETAAGELMQPESEPPPSIRKTTSADDEHKEYRDSWYTAGGCQAYDTVLEEAYDTVVYEAAAAYKSSDNQTFDAGWDACAKGADEAVRRICEDIDNIVSRNIQESEHQTQVLRGHIQELESQNQLLNDRIKELENKNL